MALNYEVKKRVFGFDETKTEKYVAQMKTLGVVGFRPGINAKSQDKLEDVTASTIYRRKIIFTPGFYFKDMLTRASVEKMDWSGNGTVSGGGSSKPNPDGGGSDGDQGENPLG